MIARLASALGMILLTVAGMAQGIRYDSSVTTVARNVPAGAQAPIYSVPNAKIIVCSDSTCVTQANIYSNSALTNLVQQPLTADGQGRFGFWVTPGNYFYQVQSVGGAVLGTYPLTLTSPAGPAGPTGPQGPPGSVGLPISAPLIGSDSNGAAIAVANPQLLAPFVNAQTPYYGGYIFGDSTKNGYVAVPYDRSFFGFISSDIPGPWKNYGLSGGWTSDVAAESWGRWDYTTSYHPTLVDYEGAINDANNVDTTGSLNNARGAITSGLTHIAIPVSSQIISSSATGSGSWAAITSSNLAVNAATGGTGMQSSATGATRTYTLPSGANVAYWWAGQDSNAGTFTVSLNGSLQTNFCTGSTTFNSFGCNGQNLASPFNNGYGFLGQTFAGGSTTGPNTLVVTVTSTSGNVYDIAAATIAPSANVLVGVEALLKQQGDANSSITADYNTVINSVYSTLYSRGLTNLFYADSRAGVAAGSGYPAARAFDATNDYATNAICGVSSPPLHPNGCGYRALEQIFVSAAAAAGHPISINNTGTHSTATAPFYIYAPQFPGTTDFSNDLYLNPLGGFDNSNRMPGVNFLGGSLNQGNLFTVLNARVALEAADDAINRPALKLMTNAGGDYPIAFCSNGNNSPRSSDLCNGAVYTGGQGTFFKYTLHLGASAQWATTQPTPGNWHSLAFDSMERYNNNFSNATVVYLQSGTTSYNVPPCKPFGGDGSGNWIQWIYNDSGTTLTSVSFNPNPTVVDKLNGSTSATVISSIPPNASIFLQCSQGTAANTNITMQEAFPPGYGVTANQQVTTPSGTSTFHVTNGIITSITTP